MVEKPLRETLKQRLGGCQGVTYPAGIHMTGSDRTATLSVVASSCHGAGGLLEHAVAPDKAAGKLHPLLPVRSDDPEGSWVRQADLRDQLILVAQKDDVERPDLRWKT